MEGLLLVLDHFRRTGRGLWLLPPLFALWINLHGSWVFGMAVLGIVIGSGMVQGEWGLVVADRWRPGQLKSLLLAGAASFAALFVNPFGYRLVLYPYDLLIRHNDVVQGLEEWQPVNFGSINGKLALALLFLLIALPLISSKRWRLQDVLLAAFALWAALSHVRFLFFAGLVIMPIVAPRLVILTFIYILTNLGLSGVVSPAKLQANSTSSLVYVAGVLGGGGWAKAMAFSLALSVIALTGTSILLGARIIYGMASHRVLPSFLGTVNRRFSTPVAASVVVGVLLIAITWIYLLATSVENAFDSVVNVSGLLFAGFYVMTALATIAYYRRRVIANVWDALLLGILPLGAAGFLIWIIFRSMQLAPAQQNWSLVGIIGLGLILMFVARFVMRSPFFQIPREAAPRKAAD